MNTSFALIILEAELEKKKTQQRDWELTPGTRDCGSGICVQTATVWVGLRGFLWKIVKEEVGENKKKGINLREWKALLLRRVIEVGKRSKRHSAISVLWESPVHNVSRH